MTGTFGRAAFTFGGISSPLMPGMLISERIKLKERPAIVFARSSASVLGSASKRFTLHPKMHPNRGFWLLPAAKILGPKSTYQLDFALFFLVGAPGLEPGTR